MRIGARVIEVRVKGKSFEGEMGNELGQFMVGFCIFFNFEQSSVCQEREEGLAVNTELKKGFRVNEEGDLKAKTSWHVLCTHWVHLGDIWALCNWSGSPLCYFSFFFFFSLPFKF